MKGWHTKTESKSACVSGIFISSKKKKKENFEFAPHPSVRHWTNCALIMLTPCQRTSIGHHQALSSAISKDSYHNRTCFTTNTMTSSCKKKLNYVHTCRGNQYLQSVVKRCLHCNLIRLSFFTVRLLWFSAISNFRERFRENSGEVCEFYY